VQVDLHTSGPLRQTTDVGADAVTLLDRPVYGMSQAARLLNLRTDGLRRWIDGYEIAGKSYPPVIREERTLDDVVTWGEFVEAGYLREYRAHRVSLQYLRPVIGLLRERLGVKYPLATLRPYASGRQLALEVQNLLGLSPELSIVIIGRDGSLQLADSAAAFLKKVEFGGASEIVERLFPLGQGKPIVLDPDRNFGEPTVSGTVRTDVIAELVDAGEEPEQLAEIYELRVSDIRAAVEFERRYSADASTAA
jgi:uncharacterized protein (DUF433 family)